MDSESLFLHAQGEQELLFYGLVVDQCISPGGTMVIRAHYPKISDAGDLKMMIKFANLYIPVITIPRKRWKAVYLSYPDGTPLEHLFSYWPDAGVKRREENQTSDSDSASDESSS